MSKQTVTLEVPAGMAPDVFEKAMTVVAGGAVPLTIGTSAAAPASCGCGGTASADAWPVTSGRTAAAGSTADYTEVNDNVREAIQAAFGTNDNWLWIKRWDDNWAIFELESTDSLTGATSTDDVWVAITVGPDGTVTVNRETAVVGQMEFRPDSTGDPVSITAAAKVMNVTADGEVSEVAFNDVASKVESIEDTVAALAEDVATIVGKNLTPAEAVEELPQPPELT